MSIVNVLTVDVADYFDFAALVPSLGRHCWISRESRVVGNAPKVLKCEGRLRLLLHEFEFGTAREGLAQLGFPTVPFGIGGIVLARMNLLERYPTAATVTLVTGV
jgi:hypothetical protein